jgi:diacylglycerol kinase (ATP)
MRVLVVCNPASGRGKGPRVAAETVAVLTRAGMTAAQLDVDRRDAAAFLAQLHDAAQVHDIIVIAGGDGTVHFALPALIGARGALYHLPMGTENLFSREFGMRRAHDTLLRAITRSTRLPMDIATLQRGDGAVRHFAIMCSVGPDAGVIERLAAARTGAISHLSYTMPVLREVVKPRVATMRVEVDGKPVVIDGTGMLVVANTRQYALRIDHAHRASASDGLLDVVFMPATGGIDALLWTLRSRLRERHDADGSIYATGTSVRVTTDDARAVYQLDGEHGGHAAQGPLTFGVLPGALTVLDAREVPA